MIRKQSGIQLTRNQQKEILDARREVDNMDPPQEACPAIEDDMFCFAILADRNKGTVYNNLTGKFLVQSLRDICACLCIMFIQKMQSSCNP